MTLDPILSLWTRTLSINLESNFRAVYYIPDQLANSTTPTRPKLTQTPPLPKPDFNLNFLVWGNYALSLVPLSLFLSHSLSYLLSQVSNLLHRQLNIPLLTPYLNSIECKKLNLNLKKNLNMNLKMNVNLKMNIILILKLPQT